MALSSWLTVLHYLLWVMSAWWSSSGFFPFVSKLLLSSGGGWRLALLIIAVVGVLMLGGFGIAWWLNGHFQYGYKDWAVYQALAHTIPLQGVKGTYLALSPILGGWWGAAGATLYAVCAYFLR